MRTKKRLFIGLLLLCIAVIAVLVAAIWTFLIWRRNNFSQYLVWFVIVMGVLLVIFLSLGLGALVFSIYRGQNFNSLSNLINRVVTILYPFAILFGKIFGIPEDDIRHSFIEVNNYVVCSGSYALSPERILILAPHCLQNNTCTHKITTEVSNCRLCGKCSVGDLRQLSAQYGSPLIFATGGTLARAALKKLQPQAAVAVACERDLASGILDAYPLPVFGVLLERPNGPCFNTRVTIAGVEEAIRFFCSAEGRRKRKRTKAAFAASKEEKE